jgi:hypothetical protein
LYERGQIFKWETRLVFIDEVTRYKIGEEERLTGRVREVIEGDEIALETIMVDFNKEKDNLSFIGNMQDIDYIEFITAAWHKRVPETRNYQVCSMKEATHVIFTEIDLDLAGDDGKGFSPLKVYPIQKEEESGDFYIIDENEDIIIGFDLFIPCEYLKKESLALNKQNHRVLKKEKSNNVIDIADYLKQKKN